MGGIVPKRRILGIDPGTRFVGYGLIEERGDTFRCLECGVIRAGGGALPGRLLVIFDRLSEVLRRRKPRVVSLEKIFYDKNVRTTIVIGEGRGVAMLAAARAKARLFEYTPSEIKKAVTGNGRASKEQVGSMVSTILGLNRSVPEDAADALAAALCHAFRNE
ncbi:MAG: crossover junction endodeoxyribonuclease RuvC [Planctomycetes bacterium RBG_16_59_8]|nr:MAG: crossover junction endodeoxyribonuclease RuvC [Planctomycetes bacterium RBG_16_59_8]